MTPDQPESPKNALLGLDSDALAKLNAFVPKSVEGGGVESTILVDSEDFTTPLPLQETLKRQKRLARFTLLIGARDLLYRKAMREEKEYPERTAYCLRVKVPGTTPAIWRSESKGKARYKNMRTCGSVWACAVCGARISEVRRAELGEAISASKEKGWSIFMVTFTLQHEKAQALTEVLNQLKAAYSDFRHGKAWNKAEERMALEGTVQGKETTYGDHGWHPHLHVLFFSSAPALDIESVRDWMKKRWVNMVSKHGGFATYESGLDLTISTDTEALARYPEKMSIADIPVDAGTDFSRKPSWSIAAELTKQVAKIGKAGVTPLQLLAHFMAGGAAADLSGDLWLEYYAAFKGQRQLWWSQGLKEKLGIAKPELTDEEIAELGEADEKEFLVLAAEILQAIDRTERRRNSRGQLLEIAHGGDLEAVWRYLGELGVSNEAPEWYFDEETWEMKRHEEKESQNK